MRRDSQRIADILEASAQVALYIRSRTLDDFTVNRIFQDAVLRQLTIVGEASTNLSEDFTSRHPEIPWAQIAGFRNRIVYDYFGFNLDTAQQIATVARPELAAVLNPILALEFPDAPDAGAL